ncbi:AAA family ATPase [Nodosilinea sp. LEGE 07088]|uniref:AAA family ATPase n=1 Tax=Nodosilinea sp. LEGE 07088 TaxID=2777968 RepID=UPI0018819E4D|nr:AAA family ATPase [Nodosilinea sp. LEGE 07088]MBE9141360.1 AAA family ATPase [Nodosilinea sp. LEGE 07088]
MRIDRIEIRNFKKFSDCALDLHPQFTLLVGDNGTGKTSLLDALAIAAGVWLVNAPDTTLSNSKRNILTSEIHLEAIESDGITQFIEHKPVQIKAVGRLGDREGIEWTRQIKADGSRTSNAEAKIALDLISELYRRDQAREKLWFPIVAYYGAGRAWLPSNKTDPKARQINGVSRRWHAFYDCLDERIRIADLQTWFQKEALASLQRQGQMRLSYEVVKFAILGGIPAAHNLWFDSDRSEIIIAIDNSPVPFSNLSAGQKTMVALIADIAIKIVTQNAAFLSDANGIDSSELPLILQKTPGLILIDEIDVHLHPKWQRHVVEDLTHTFPAIQFVCTTHSPIVISEVPAECIRSLKAEAATTPANALGLDANRVLDEVMNVPERNKAVSETLHTVFQLIDDEDFEQARQTITKLSEQVGELDPEITRARGLIKFLEN